jgi:hypothetical protein
MALRFEPIRPEFGARVSGVTINRTPSPRTAYPAGIALASSKFTRIGCMW